MNRYEGSIVCVCVMEKRGVEGRGASVWVWVEDGDVTDTRMSGEYAVAVKEQKASQ